MTDATRIFSADLVYPVCSSPIREAAVLVESGRVVEVGPRDQVVDAARGVEEVALHGVIVPGLVNAHTHLQFTRFAHLGKSQHGGFEEWSVAFDAEYAASASGHDWLGAAMEGAQQALESGTTTIADVCTDLDAAPALGKTGISGTVYLEVLGNTWRQWQSTGRERFLSDLELATQWESNYVRLGVSPHAPYSLDTKVLADLALLARKLGRRLHTHLGESAYEEEYCRFGTGPLADFVAGFGRDFQVLVEGGAERGPAEFARSLGLLGEDCHVAHGIYLDKLGRKQLRDTGTAVALCPRSNEVIGLEAPPVAAYLAEGNKIAVGTDSLSSSPSLDLMEDVRLLYSLARSQGYSELDLASRLIEAATVGGARALGLTDGGYLRPGARADLALFDVDVSVEGVEGSLVHEGAGSCRAVVVAGTQLAPESRPG